MIGIARAASDAATIPCPSGVRLGRGAVGASVGTNCGSFHCFIRSLCAPKVAAGGPS
jgi:hypothetical protein